MKRPKRGGPALALIVLSLIAGGSRAQELGGFPKSLVTWVPASVTPVFQGAGGDAWDRKIRERGWILFEGGTFHLWYTGYNDDRSPNRFLGHATSSDGLRWERDPSNPLLLDSWVEDMCVVKEDGLYVMFAEGKDDIAHQLTSPDGRRWTDGGALDIRRTGGEPISAGPRGTPAVFVEKGVWYLFYERGDRGVWLATSSDRIVWKNVSDEPVLSMGPENYDSQAVAFNQVIRRDGTYYAFYHANSQRPWKEWTTCIARSRDLVQWEKYRGNPILDGNRSSGILVESPLGTRLYTMHPEVQAFVRPRARP